MESSISWVSSFWERSQRMDWASREKTLQHFGASIVHCVCHSSSVFWEGPIIIWMERNIRLGWKENPLYYSCYMNFIGGRKNNLEQTFRSSNCEIGNFYRAQVLMVTVPEVFSDMCLKLLALVPTSAGLERIFSTMGTVEDGKRNNLDSAKTAKL